MRTLLREPLRKVTPSRSRPKKPEDDRGSPAVAGSLEVWERGQWRIAAGPEDDRGSPVVGRKGQVGQKGQKGRKNKKGKG